MGIQAFCAVFLGLESLINPIIPVLQYVGVIYILWLTNHIVLSKPDTPNY